MPPGDHHPVNISPFRVLFLILIVVFAAELSIMVVLAAAVAPESRSSLVEAVIDALVLVATLTPALWFLVVRPLRVLVNERGALLTRAMTIQEAERARIARDLHDELGQTQTSILLGVRSIADAETLEQARSRAESIHEMTVEAIDATRRMARGLSPAVLADFGIGPAVERMCMDVATATDVEIVREIRLGTVRPESAVEIAAYRFVQEALTNAIRHSGATRVRVGVRQEADRIELAVADNGQGIPHDSTRGGSARAGTGLAGLRERVTLMGGSFRLTSAPSGGTSLQATLPT